MSTREMYVDGLNEQIEQQQKRIAELEGKLDEAARADVNGIEAAWQQTNNYIELYQRSQRTIDEMARVLRDVEWSGNPIGGPSCPCCRRWKVEGHQADCAINVALKKARVP